VVAVGVTLVEPLAAVEVKDPGEIYIFVAPVVAQLSVLLAPGLMLAGFAANDVMAAGLTVPEAEPAWLPQPARPLRASRKTAPAQKHRTGALRSRDGKFTRTKGFRKSTRPPLIPFLCSLVIWSFQCLPPAKALR
jgi:hypothetical protein